MAKVHTANGSERESNGVLALRKEEEKLECDYLVVGAGASGLAFVDTMLTEIPSLKIIIVDKHEAPGGHWNDAYDFVRLHQPSVAYGVPSKQLEGNWLWCLLCRWQIPFFHRATKKEILVYFREVMQKWISKKQVKYYTKCEFKKPGKGQEEEQEKLQANGYTFTSLDGTKKYSVQVREKWIDATLWEPAIPSKQELKFPVDTGVDVVTPNDIYFWSKSSKREESKKRKYLILGCGKTAMDCVVFLQKSKMKIHPDNITMVVPNDVWLFNRYPPDFSAGPWNYFPRVLELDGDKDKAMVSLEEEGIVLRFDKKKLPTRCRLAVIEDAELKLLQGLKNIVRRGRVQAIRLDGEKNLRVEFGQRQTPLHFPSTAEGEQEVVVVNACSPGPFNGHPWTITTKGSEENKHIFTSKTCMRLSPLAGPPAGLSMSALAYLEAARKKGKLDIAFGRQILGDSTASGEDILRELVLPVPIGDFCNFTGSPIKGQALQREIGPMLFPALLFSLGNRNCKKAYKWMQRNRLSPFSIPRYRSNFWSHLNQMIEKKHLLDLTEKDEKKLQLMVEKLRPLKHI